MAELSSADVDAFLIDINRATGFAERRSLLLVENQSLSHSALGQLFEQPPRIKNTGIITHYEHQGLRLQPHYIGLQPLEINGERWLTVIAPKGVLQFCGSKLAPEEISAHIYDAFHRFFQMRFSISPQAAVKRLDRASLGVGQNPSRILVLLLAQSYQEVLSTLLRRDFRRFYQYQEQTFQGARRGRILLDRYVQHYASGQPQLVPCAFETFTSDNFSNRILKCALNHLLGLARRENMGAFLLHLLAPLLEQLAEVSDILPRNIPYHQAKLRHVSTLYARALDMAEVIIGEHGDYSTGINQALYQSSKKDNESTNFPFLYNTYDCFERFVEGISESCARRFSPTVVTSRKQLAIQGVFAQQFSVRLTEKRSEHRQFIDFALESLDGLIGLGDAKYADCVSWDRENIRLNKRFKIGYFRQLYTYMRWKSCDQGLFVVPVWWDDAAVERAKKWPGSGWDDGNTGWLRFAAKPDQSAFDVYYSTSPLDRDDRGDNNHRVRFLGINMMKPPADCQRDAAQHIHSWLSSPHKAPPLVT